MSDKLYSEMPMIALRGLVIFPSVQLHFDVGRPKSLAAINEAMSRDRLVFLAAQKELEDEDPSPEGIYEVGCVTRIKQIIRLPGDGLRVVAEGLFKAKRTNVVSSDPIYLVETDILNDKIGRGSAMLKSALLRTLKDDFENYAAENRKISPDVILHVASNEDFWAISEYIAANVPFTYETKQKVLEETNPLKRLEYVIAQLKAETELLKLEHEIERKVHESMDENQRDYFLREQMKVISEELGEDENPEEEAEEYRKKIAALKAPDSVKERLFKEVNRLLKMPLGSHEATVVRGYLDTCLELPFGIKTKEKHDINAAKKQLDRDHFGLEKVKERIIEVLAARALAPDIKGQIICLVGPPGVGKTSIARSIASCMGRNYARISLGGVKDESDIRGHRKTYIGSMPGRIIEAVKQAKSQNPLILMDEIDKLGSDFRGDPSAALLEALDPEQNVEFHDHFIEIPFDLSDVFFIVTANSTDTIPAPLLDRMEVISLAGYTREEKFNIAKKHLLKKQLARHGLTSKTCKISNDAIYCLIDNYTREAGVRNLERNIASLCRKAAAKIVGDGVQSVSIKASNIKDFLGNYKYKPENYAAKNQVGVVNGLAWTSVGGEMLQIEAAVLKGGGKVILTGSLGNVMKESATAAVSFIRSKSEIFNIPEKFYKESDIHIHAPQGAVPKDGPSAGITMTIALLSALSDTPVKGNVAMTGEISLTGRVMPIGGLKEKTMAAYKYGMKTVIISKENLPDLDEIDPKVRESLDFVAVERIEEALPIAFADDGYIKKTETEKRKHFSGNEKSDERAANFA